MSDKTMSHEFYNWLDECPCQWFRDKDESNKSQYTFIEEVEE